ncbi:DUF4159 domain-containing protein [bacterium]|nr:DUF4159 domain-containing protein [bacterium]
MINSCDTKRFFPISGAPDFQKHEKETRGFLIFGFFAVIAFIGIAGSYTFLKKPVIKVVKPFMTELVLRKKGLTTPLVIKKRSFTRKFPMTNGIRFRLPADRISMKLPPSPDAMNDEINMAYDYTGKHFPDDGLTFPKYENPDNPGGHYSQDISLKNEMFALGDLDNGIYKATVIQDSRNKKNIHGFVYIATVWGTEFAPPDQLRRSVLSLAEAVNRYTGIHAKIDSHLMLDSSRLFSMPLIYITTDTAFELTPREAENLGKYLRNGGFAVLDNAAPNTEYSPAEASLRMMLRNALGKDARFEPIPDSHHLYHCYFDFNDGPPLGSETRKYVPSALPMATMLSSLTGTVHYLEGVWIKNRLVAVYSDKGYALKWKDFENNSPQLKIGVNMVVFALTQEDGITQRNMKRFTGIQ